MSLALAPIEANWLVVGAGGGGTRRRRRLMALCAAVGECGASPPFDGIRSFVPGITRQR